MPCKYTGCTHNTIHGSCRYSGNPKECAYGKSAMLHEMLNEVIANAKAELARLKKLVFGDEVREKLLTDHEHSPAGAEECWLCCWNRVAITDFQQAIKDAMEPTITNLDEPGICPKCQASRCLHILTGALAPFCGECGYGFATEIEKAQRRHDSQRHSGCD